MTVKRSLGLLLSAIAVCAPVRAATGVALIKGTQPGSAIEGRATLEETKAGLKIMAQVHGLTPGSHGFHIHEYGDCSDLGRSAGSHFNPMHSPHGDVVKSGMKKAHAGDLGNITADAKGDASIEVVVPKLSLTGGKYDVAGRSLIVHEKADDFSQPAGNAGGRAACGVIVLAPLQQ